MPIAASLLIKPNGPIALEMFPGLTSVTLESLVSTRLTAAYADARIDNATNSDATKDKLARPLAIYTILIEDVYPRMLVEPNSVTSTDKGASAYTDKQRADFLAWANGFLADFENQLPEEDLDPVGQWGAGCAHRAS